MLMKESTEKLEEVQQEANISLPKTLNSEKNMLTQGELFR